MSLIVRHENARRLVNQLIYQSMNNLLRFSRYVLGKKRRTSSTQSMLSVMQRLQSLGHIHNTVLIRHVVACNKNCVFLCTSFSPVSFSFSSSRCTSFPDGTDCRVLHSEHVSDVGHFYANINCE